jgi:DNA-binding response OmpR family regulator
LKTYGLSEVFKKKLILNKYTYLMNKPSILWVDDEIDLLTPHVMFLEQKGFVVHRCNSGADAISFCATQAPDLILLDENMPGLSGLETLTALKKSNPLSAVIMVTI